MGINGLLSLLENSTCIDAYLDRFYGKRVAVDVKTWFYKGLAKGNCRKYIQDFIDLFAMNNVHAVFVYDGEAPPEKGKVLEKRNEYREKYEHDHPDAPSMKITPELIEEMKDLARRYSHITVVQAPGEADPQLAYMEAEGLVDAIVTEDSDLIVYGCQRIIYKLLPYGKCKLYERARLKLKVDFTVFRWICLIAGCDYLNGLNGYGLKKATQLVRFKLKPQEPYNDDELKRILKKAGADNLLIEKFIRAEHLFRHADIVDPRTGEIKPLTPKDIQFKAEAENGDDLDFFTPEELEHYRKLCRTMR